MRRPCAALAVTLAVAHGLLPAGAAPRGGAQRPATAVSIYRASTRRTTKYYQDADARLDADACARCRARRRRAHPPRAAGTLGARPRLRSRLLAPRRARGMGGPALTGRRGGEPSEVRVDARRRDVRCAGRVARPRRLRGRARVPRRPRVRARDRQHRAALAANGVHRGGRRTTTGASAVPSLSDRALRPRPAGGTSAARQALYYGGSRPLCEEGVRRADHDPGRRPTGPFSILPASAKRGAASYGTW